MEHLEKTSIETGAKVDNLNMVMTKFETTLVMSEKARVEREIESEKARVARESAIDKKLDTIFRMVDGITCNTASIKDIENHEIRIRKIEIDDMAEVARKSDVKDLSTRVSKIENADAVKWKNATWAIGLIIAGFILNEGKAAILNMYEPKPIISKVVTP